jgi:hypothetical protein
MLMLAAMAVQVVQTVVQAVVHHLLMQLPQ